MNKIGFKNFRRFQEFKSLQYNDITFLVGRNNSGKSTLVKALLLIHNYLKSDNISTFSFGNNSLEDANIVTFGRALNSDTDEKYIEFSYELEGFHLQLKIGASENETDAKVYYLRLDELSSKISIEITPFKQVTVKLIKSVIQTEGDKSDDLINVESRLKDLSKKILKAQSDKSSKEYIELKAEYRKLRQHRSILEESQQGYNYRKKELSKYAYHFSTPINVQNNSLKEVVQNLKDYLIHNGSTTVGKDTSKQFRELNSEYKTFRELKEYLTRFENEANIIQNKLNDFVDKIQLEPFYYLGANPSKQSALFQIRDKNNALAQAIHNYFQLGIPTSENEAERFVKEWMQEFNIGDNCSIRIYAGEAYELLVIKDDKLFPLADKGMGSLQLMLLILRLATIIHKQKIKTNVGLLNNPIKITPTILIEEPELNLHPALQSRLADLFHSVYRKYGLNFIIETHSEYILRNTQLIVKENQYETPPNENPFCVLYFDDDKQWKMDYREDGKFTTEFGTGFFDETRKIIRKMI